MARIKKDNKQDKGKEPVKKQSKRQLQRVADRPKDAPKKSAVELQQLDGKIYNKYGVKSIDELLGETTSKYKTSDIKEYEAYLNRMNTSDLQAHAVTVQVMPKEDRRLLIKLLLKQFQINNSSKLNTAKQIPPVKNLSQEVLDIIAEGR